MPKVQFKPGDTVVYRLAGEKEINTTTIVEILPGLVGSLAKLADGYHASLTALYLVPADPSTA